MIDEKKLIEELEKLKQEVNMPVDIVWNNLLKVCIDTVNEQPKVVTDTNVGSKWIPIEWHETTDDDGIDKERYPFYLDCAMPDDAQEIIICRKNGWVCVDTCIYDDGYSLDSGADWIEDVIAWMPLPPAYNAERGGKND